MARFFQLVLFVVLCIVSKAHAAPLPLGAVPEPLKTWVPWVMHGHEMLACSAEFNNAQNRRCVWPHKLGLQMTGQGLSFRQEVQVMGEPSWVSLPGEAGLWPQNVKLNGQAVAVVLREDIPHVFLPVGQHVLVGGLSWAELPPSLQLPQDVGTLNITLNGQPFLGLPDEQGQLLLKNSAASDEPSQDALTVRTARLVDDDIPLRITTRFDLAVAGKPREIKLPAALLPGFVPETLESSLPTRLQENGELRVQVRPGNWTVEVRGHLLNAVASLTLPEVAKDEIWSVLAHTDLRMISLEGLASVDPKQSALPEAWRAYPAYQIKPGQTLKLVESRRANPDPGADTLALARDIWLDFDGGGYSLRDKITGQLNRTWRLDMQPPFALGRAWANGADQPITQTEGAVNGLELRQGALNLSADSRVEGATRTLPATAWRADVNTVSAQLNLPPGWMLLHATGVDKAEQSWVSMWTLWDFFFVLLCTLAAARLLGLGGALVLACALLVSWHMPGAPKALWLVLLGLLALIRVLPVGKLRNVAVSGSRVCTVLVVLVLLPYAVAQIRLSIYPNLEHPVEMVQDGAPSASFKGGAALPRSSPSPVAASALGSLNDAQAHLQRSKEVGSYAYKQSSMDQLDPNTKVQTGPGLPAWQWASHALVWQGPVLQSQQLQLYLLSPGFTVVWRLASLGLLLLALWWVARALPRWPAISKETPGPAAGSVVAASARGALVLVLLLGAMMPDLAQAKTPEPTQAPVPQLPEVPGRVILQELRTKLSAAPACMPQCAEIARLGVVAQGNRIELRLEVHALADVSVPLPGQGANWRPTQVLVDGKPGVVSRGENGVLWLAARTGVSQVVLMADVGDAASVEVNLPMPAQEVTPKLEGWSLSGLDARNLTSGALSLTRTTKVVNAPDAGTQRDALPAFVQVERVVRLGLRWTVDTHITRLTPSRAPVRIKVKLLEGEAVNDNVVRVEDGHALLQLGSQEEVSFVSSLSERPELKLQASTEPQQIEVWRLDPGPQWHVNWSGMAPIQYAAEGVLMPYWRPWPGESVGIAVSKPAGVVGQTITLDRMGLSFTPGLRATDVNASAVVRTSQGGNHRLQLPEGVEFLNLQLNQQNQAIRPQGRELLIALTPGEHTIGLQWREPRGMGWRFATTEFGFNAAGVNARTHIKIPTDRVVLAVGGPAVGPAVLFWGTLLAMAGVAVALGRSRFAPLGVVSWFLLGLGLMQNSLIGAVLVTGWFGVMAARQRFGLRDAPPTKAMRTWFNAAQVLLVLWSLVAAMVLLNAVRVGLLGYPDMMITGNGSYAGVLNWYQDRFASQPTTAWVVSMPVLAYRLLMLVWALWLAASMLKWVKWAWQSFSGGGGGYWLSLRKNSIPGTD